METQGIVLFVIAGVLLTLAAFAVVRVVARPGREASPDDVSVLSSLGAALVGLRVGQSIVWPDRVGAELVLRVRSTG